MAAYLARWTRCSGRWPTRAGGCCSTASTSATARPCASCAPGWTWPASRSASTSRCSRRPTSSRPSAAGGRSCTTSTRRPSTRSPSAGSPATTRDRVDALADLKRALEDTADGQALVRLHDLHPHHARAALAGADRARVHRALLGHHLRHRLEGRLADELGPARRRRSPTPSRSCSSPTPTAGWRTPGTRSRPSWPTRSASATRRRERARGRAALEGDLRHRAARRRRSS